jgi:phytol kinase
MPLVVTILAVLALLLANEAWWRTHTAHHELGRKFVHLTVGSFVAFWPFFLDWQEIKLLSLAFLAVVGLSKYFHVFRAIHSVQRPTWGELYFALAVGAVAFITHNKWIYMTALLQMSLADGLAAIIGVSFGGSKSYRVFNHTKSLAGTLAFLVVSAVLLALYSNRGGADLGPVFILAVALAAGIMENIGVYGLDNLLVPVLVAAALVNH